MDRDALIKAMELTAATANAPRPIDIKGWGTVYVRAMLVSEVEAQAADTADGKDKNRFARAAARVMCDEKGVLLFDADKEEDIKRLARQPWKALRRVLEETEKDLEKLTPRREFLMDLALEFGMPFGTLTRSMTESEFGLWQRYAQKRMLPARRVELQLARICQLIAVTMGGAKDATVMDYMLHVVEEDRAVPVDDEGDLEAAKEAFQFRPRTRKVEG